MHGLLIFIIALAIAGWFFIRNYFMYDGDFLGLDSREACGEIYGKEELRLSNRDTYENHSESVISMLFHTKWIIRTVVSFFEIPGMTNLGITLYFSTIYIFLIFIGIVGSMAVFKENGAHNRFFIINLYLVVFIPVLLSIRYSYAYDYQPQGRYVMPGMPAVMLLTVVGYYKMDSFLRRRINIADIIAAFWIMLFASAFIWRIIPLGMNGIYG